MPTVYEFKVALQTKEQLEQTLAVFDNNALTAPVAEFAATLENGEPAFKTIFTMTETEEEAIQKVDAYVAKTPYREIEDKKLI